MVSGFFRTAVPGAIICATASMVQQPSARAEEFRFTRDAMSPVVLPLALRASGESDDRLIEPTSPILGKHFAEALKKDSRSPEEILQAIESDFPGWRTDVRFSAVAYLETMLPGLREYCTQGDVATAGEWQEVEPAAIPLQTLKPRHAQYARAMESLLSQYMDGTLSERALEARAREAANDFQHLRDNCPVVLKIGKLEGVAQAILAGRMDALVVLNHDISSPEAAWPRAQFSINGFTQYVYRELLAYPRLRSLLKDLYQAEAEWIALRAIGGIEERFLWHVETQLLDKGYPGNKILLALAFSTRNMPSLDIHYGRDAQKALELEVYFWKFKAFRENVLDHELPRIFPNHVFERNPGVYHYMTAALLACEVYNHGYHVGTALAMGYLSKLAYKSHKFISEIRAVEGLSLDKAKQIAREQGFSTGLDAGKYGGRNGVEVCLRSDRRERLRREAEIDARVSALRRELDGWKARRSRHEITKRQFEREERRIKGTVDMLEREKRGLRGRRDLNRA